MIKRLLNFFGKQDDPSISAMATAHFIDRRHNLRVNYPEIGGLGNLPEVIYKDQKVQAKNISVGGVCLQDDLNLFGESVGESIELTLLWDDFQVVQKAQIVGITLNRKHIQFKNVDVQTELRLKLLLKPGYLGAKMSNVGSSSKQIELAVEELWLGSGGESLSFPKEKGDAEVPFAEIKFLNNNIVFPRQGPPRTGLALMPEKEKALIADLAVFLANIPKAGDRIKELISRCQQFLRPVQ